MPKNECWISVKEKSQSEILFTYSTSKTADTQQKTKNNVGVANNLQWLRWTFRANQLYYYEIKCRKVSLKSGINQECPL